MSTPFEFFRTPIIIRRFTDGFYLNGIWQEGSQITLSGNFVAGNIINITINSVALVPINFTTSQLVTLNLIRAALLLQPGIQDVVFSDGNLVISIVPTPPNLSSLTVFTVTGGASQPNITISNSPTLIQSTASIQPTNGDEVQLIPEGRNDRETFKMYTSTQIFPLTTQNPDQVEVLKAPFTGRIFEVIQLYEWQNNANFNIVNHYKYLAMRLHPLPG